MSTFPPIDLAGLRAGIAALYAGTDRASAQLRGAGELLGTRQSGLPDMRLADLSVHGELLQAARDDARLVIDRDPDLQSERGRALRALLYLFRRDDAVRTLRAG